MASDPLKRARTRSLAVFEEEQARSASYDDAYDDALRWFSRSRRALRPTTG